MKISLNWLKNYINLDDVSVDEVVHKLTVSGLEVEEVTDYNKIYDNFVVGFVKERKKHPNADKLSLCVVNDGNNDLPVVCGAPNVEAGQKIVFAKIDAVVPNGGFKITKAKIRGEVSNGMICSERELGISDNHDGIMVLDSNAESGTPIAKYLGLDDVVIEISITPNRSDALSHIGAARDLASILGKDLKIPEVKLQESNENANELAAIEIKNPDGCARYIGKVITDVKVGESPEWLKKYLKAIGSRSINNVVDVTNFILYELGQPLHAFDLDKLAGRKIIVKNASEGEKFVSLDSKERVLKNSDLMICDAEKSVAIAGIMGGENSEVTADTKNILIESAFFNPKYIRKTAKRLGMSTDASYRFERGCDQEITKLAAERAAQLISEMSGGKIAKGIIDINPVPFIPKKVNLRFSRIKRILGYEVGYTTVISILNKLGFTLSGESDKENIFVFIPSFRHDIEREIDVVEEIARIYGYDLIPEVERIAVTLEAKTDQLMPNEEVRNLLVSMGFNEILTNSLLSEEIASEFGNPIEVLSPQSSEMSHLRSSLVPGALMTVARNEKVKENSLKLFEIGHTFNKLNESINDFNDFSEESRLLLIIAGYSQDNCWYQKERKFDFYDLKGCVDSFLKKFSLDKEIYDSYNSFDNKLLEFGYQKLIKNKPLGFGGKIKPAVLKKYDISSDVYIFDFSLDVLYSSVRKEKKYSELLKYPKIIKDFAVVIDNNIETKDVIKTILSINSKILKEVKVFDVFVSENLGINKKSVAFQLDFYDETRTLTDEEAESDFWKSIEIVKSKFNAVLRG